MVVDMDTLRLERLRTWSLGPESVRTFKRLFTKLRNVDSGTSRALSLNRPASAGYLTGK